MIGNTQAQQDHADGLMTGEGYVFRYLQTNDVDLYRAVLFGTLSGSIVRSEDQTLAIVSQMF